MRAPSALAALLAAATAVSSSVIGNQQPLVEQKPLKDVVAPRKLHGRFLHITGTHPSTARPFVLPFLTDSYGRSFGQIFTPTRIIYQAVTRMKNAIGKLVRLVTGALLEVPAIRLGLWFGSPPVATPSFPSNVWPL